MSDMIGIQPESGPPAQLLSVASNEDHVAAKIYAGEIAEADRWREVARLYRCQLDAMTKRYRALRGG